MPTAIELLAPTVYLDRSNLKYVELANYADSKSRRSKKVIEQVTKAESKASEKLKLRQGTYSKIYSSEVDTKYGVRPRELESAPLAWFAPKLSPHSLPILIQREYKSEHSSLMDSVCYKWEVELYL